MNPQPANPQRTKLALVHSETDVAHELGYVGDWLALNGYQVTRIYRSDLFRNHSGEPVAFPEADLLINLGSLSSVAEGYALEPAQAEIEAVSNWVDSGKTYVGICFGAQVLARALGGKVERQGATFRDIETMHDPQGLGPWVRWHEDFITDAGDSRVLAKSDDAVMVFNRGAAWGIQPHLELTPETLQRMAQRVKAHPEHYEHLVEKLTIEKDHARESTFALLDQIAGNSHDH